MSIPSSYHPRQRIDPTAYALLSLMVLTMVAGLFLKGEVAEFCRQNWNATLMALVGILAYIGLESRIARLSAWLLIGVLLAIFVVLNTAMAGMIFTGSNAGGKIISTDSITTCQMRQMVCISVASLMAALTALLPLPNKFHRLCSMLTGNTEWTSVRVMALGGVIAISLILFVPLVALGEPPISAMMGKDGGFAKKLLAVGNDPSSVLRADFYGLCWILLAAPLAVGFGVRRNWRECLERLGMVRLSPREIGVAIVLTALMYFLSEGVDFAISQIWGFFDWPRTDENYYDALFKAYSSPLGAVVMGVTAGFGEEFLSRGILLPRLGIFLSSIFFAAMHAYQYNWDNLINVFLFGVVLGIIRKKTSTSVCVIIHGGYDFVLCIICLLSK